MSEYTDEIIEDHEYDGIQEFDNPMPAWWKNIFYLSIAFSVVYVIGQALGMVHTYGDDLHVAQRDLQRQRQAYAAKQPPLIVTQEVLLAAMVEPEGLAAGQKAYKAYCASCHGDVGQGGIGPNLTDAHWLRGGQPLQVFTTIKNGTPNGMPTWNGVLRPKEMVQLVGYIHSVQQTKPAGAKAAEGEPFKPALGVDPKALAQIKAKLTASSADAAKGDKGGDKP